MFLNRIADLKLIDRPEGENILRGFDESIRRSVASQVMIPVEKSQVQFGELISTLDHAKWFMEAVGQGFLLPMASKSDVSLIENIFSLYQFWLLFPEKRPKGLKQDEQYFIRRIVLNFSMLFEPRQKEEETEMEVRCLQCRKCLKEVFLASAKSQGHSFQPETWDCYLKIMIGVVDQIMIGHPLVLKKLGVTALRVLIDIWIMATTDSNPLWTSLYSISRKSDWIAKTTTVNHIVINQWSATCLGLTKFTLNSVYGNLYGMGTQLNISFHGDQDKREESSWDSKPEMSYIYWYRFLHLLGNPNTISSPASFSLMASSISNLVDCYIKVPKSENWKPIASYIPPTINKILDIFGDWLFEAMLLDRPTFEEGTAIATATICKIFCDVTNVEPIRAPYLATFYTALSKLLVKRHKENNNKVLYSLLLNARKLFLRDLPGSTCLIPPFFSALTKIWSDGSGAAGSSSTEAHVGVACAEIMTSLVPFPYRYRNGKFVPLLPHEAYTIDTKLKLPPLNTYLEMLSQYKIMLKHSLSMENHSVTLQTLLWCFSLLTTEICNFHKEQKLPLPKEESLWITEVLISVIVPKLASFSWVSSSALLFKAFEVLSYLRVHVIEQKFPSSEKIAEKIVRSLLNFLLDRSSVPDNDLEQQRILASAYQCLRDWIAYDDKALLWLTPLAPPVVGSHPPPTLTAASAPPQAAPIPPQGPPPNPIVPASVAPSGPAPTPNPQTNTSSAPAATPNPTPTPAPAPAASPAHPPTIQSDFFKAIKVGLESGQHIRANAAQQCFNYVANWTERAERACVADETDILFAISQAEKNPCKDVDELFEKYGHYIQWYGLDDKTIISITDYPAEKKGGSPSVLLMIRNESGKFMWHATLKLFANPKDETPNPIVKPPQIPKSIKPIADYNFRENNIPTKLEEFMKWIEQYNSKPQHSIDSDKLVKFFGVEQDTLKSIYYGLDKEISFKPPVLNLSDSNCKITFSRIFLSHSGLTIPRNLHRLTPLDPHPKLLGSLKQIDGVPEREPVCASIVYIKRSQRTANEIFTNTESSQDFKDFVESVGWKVNPQKHNEFKILDKCVKMTNAPYYSNNINEFYFLVSTFMANQSKNGLPLLPRKAEIKKESMENLEEPQQSPPASPNAQRKTPGIAEEEEPGALPVVLSTPTPTSQTRTKKFDKSYTSSSFVPGEKPVDKPTQGFLFEKRLPTMMKSAHRMSECRTVPPEAPKKIKSGRDKGAKEEPTCLVEQKRSLLLSTKIVFLWLEEEADYVEDIIFNKEKDPLDNILLFIIRPLSSGLYAIHMPKTHSKLNGNLLEFTVLPKHLLGQQVRRIATIAHSFMATNKESGYWRDPYFLVRQHKLQAIINNHSATLSTRTLYSSQFTKMRETLSPRKDDFQFKAHSLPNQETDKKKKHPKSKGTPQKKTSYHRLDVEIINESKVKAPVPSKNPLPVIMTTNNPPTTKEKNAPKGAPPTTKSKPKQPKATLPSRDSVRTTPNAAANTQGKTPQTQPNTQNTTSSAPMVTSAPPTTTPQTQPHTQTQTQQTQPQGQTKNEPPKKGLAGKLKGILF
uniref:Rap-GAP domain-containing protein n=1 Tax=Arcella intermedia TaxID=1963864 RepID=A0A6B2KWK8_9EUKA